MPMTKTLMNLGSAARTVERLVRMRCAMAPHGDHDGDARGLGAVFVVREVPRSIQCCVL